MTVLLPEGATAPIKLYEGGAALAQPDWDRPCVSALLDLPAPDGTWGCSAGQASAPCTRLVQPIRRPPCR